MIDNAWAGDPDGLVALAHHLISPEPGGCTGCGSALRADRPPVRTMRRQVFDIATITVRVIEHRLIVRRCACGAPTAAAGPAAVSASVQYGPHATAIAVYLRLGAVALPVVFISLALADVWTIDRALRASALGLVASLMFIGYVAVRRVRLPLWQAITLLAEFVLGTAVVALELLAHG